MAALLKPWLPAYVTVCEPGKKYRAKEKLHGQIVQFTQFRDPECPKKQVQAFIADTQSSILALFDNAAVDAYELEAEGGRFTTNKGAIICIKRMTFSKHKVAKGWRLGMTIHEFVLIGGEGEETMGEPSPIEASPQVLRWLKEGPRKDHHHKAPSVAEELPILQPRADDLTIASEATAELPPETTPKKAKAGATPSPTKSPHRQRPSPQKSPQKSKISTDTDPAFALPWWRLVSSHEVKIPADPYVAEDAQEKTQVLVQASPERKELTEDASPKIEPKARALNLVNECIPPTLHMVQVETSEAKTAQVDLVETAPVDAHTKADKEDPISWPNTPTKIEPDPNGKVRSRVDTYGDLDMNLFTDKVLEEIDLITLSRTNSVITRDSTKSPVNTTQDSDRDLQFLTVLESPVKSYKTNGAQYAPSRHETIKHGTALYASELNPKAPYFAAESEDLPENEFTETQDAQTQYGLPTNGQLQDLEHVARLNGSAETTLYISQTDVKSLDGREHDAVQNEQPDIHIPYTDIVNGSIASTLDVTPGQRVSFENGSSPLEPVSTQRRGSIEKYHEDFSGFLDQGNVTSDEQALEDHVGLHPEDHQDKVPSVLDELHRNKRASTTLVVPSPNKKRRVTSLGLDEVTEDFPEEPCAQARTDASSSRSRPKLDSRRGTISTLVSKVQSRLSSGADREEAERSRLLTGRSLSLSSIKSYCYDMMRTRKKKAK